MVIRTGYKENNLVFLEHCFGVIWKYFMLHDVE